MTAFLAEDHDGRRRFALQEGIVMKISHDEVRKVARLARLEVAPSEVEALSDQLGRILDYVDTLKSANTENVEPMSQVTDRVNALREDVVVDSIGTEAALANAPESEDGHFVVPKVVG